MSVASKEKLLKKLHSREYRNAYAEESVKTSLPFQIKAIREQRDWSQAILGKESDMKQNAVSRLESAEYGNLNINTLLRLANAFDCGLLVKFVPFSRLLTEFEDVSPEELYVESFESDLPNLRRWSYSYNFGDVIEAVSSGAGAYEKDSTTETEQKFIPLSAETLDLQVIG